MADLVLPALAGAGGPRGVHHRGAVAGAGAGELSASSAEEEDVSFARFPSADFRGRRGGEADFPADFRGRRAGELSSSSAEEEDGDVSFARFRSADFRGRRGDAAATRREGSQI